MLLKEVISNNHLVFSGAMGTECVKRGITCDRFSESVLNRSEDIVDIHQAYLNAGVDVLKTHTFSLSCEDLPEKEIYQLGLRACGLVKGLHPDYWVYDMSPSCREWSTEKRCQRYKTQSKLASEEDCQVVFLETFDDLAELELALNCIEELEVSFDVIPSLTSTESLSAADFIRFTELARRDKVIALGINCVSNFDMIEDILSQVRQESNFPVVLCPNKGLVDTSLDSNYYPVSDEEYTSGIKRLLMYPCTSVGGCCGTTPETMHLVCDVVSDMKSVTY